MADFEATTGSTRRWLAPKIGAFWPAACLPRHRRFDRSFRGSVRYRGRHLPRPIAIGLAGSASIDKVAGPVGEALIMTAIGLLVAVPAVLAYNFLQSRNKRINELLTGFSADVLAYINSKGAIKPVVAAAPVKAAPAPAAKK
jgi:hypothetical protein